MAPTPRSLTPFVAAVGHRLKVLRDAAGLTQAQLAEQMRIDVTTLSRIERGDAALSLRKLFDAARVFQIAPAEFLNVDVPVAAPRRLPVQTAPIVEVWHDLDRKHRALLLEVARSFAAASVEGGGGENPAQQDGESLPLAAEGEGPFSDAEKT